MKLDKEQLEIELDKLSDSSVSKVLIQFLEEKVGELNSIVGVETVKELHGRKNAVRKLKEIINRLQPRKNVDIKNEYK